MQRISVVHLVFIPYGIQLFKEFVESYKAFPAGYKHELIIVFNGITNEDETRDYHNYIKQNADFSYLPFYYVKGQDLEVYHWIAGKLSSDYILFLNGFSRFLDSNWLLKFWEGAITNDNIGLIGATGSWQSIYSSVLEANSWRWTKPFTLKENILKYITFLKAILLWHRYYKPFPNPHLRTNAFFIKRELFLSMQFKYPQTKYEAYRIESGRKSITQQILNKNLKALLIDKHGNTFQTNEWNTAKVFWNCNQEDLLISDNQTDSYANSDSVNKKRLEYLAWRKS